MSGQSFLIFQLAILVFLQTSEASKKKTQEKSMHLKAAVQFHQRRQLNNPTSN
jgi:hypothetical protein